jgi:HEAT repeat protein
MSDILDKLRGGDRRSIGQANEVVGDVLEDPSLFGRLFEGVLDDDPIVRMRAADAIEKLTIEHPEWLKPHKRKLLGPIAAIDQQEVRWHVAQLLPRLDLTELQRRKAVDVLLAWLGDASAIVRTFALQALADLAEQDPRLRRRVTKLLKEGLGADSAAVRSRSKKLLAKMAKSGG